MSERLNSDEELKREKREIFSESNFNKVERLKENLMKLEKSVVDEVDEATQSARGAIQAMGFGITPIPATDDDFTTDDDDEDNVDSDDNQSVM